MADINSALELKGRKKLERLKELETEQRRWHRIWQLAGEYVHTTKQSFVDTQNPGDFLNQNVFDSTARLSNVKMSSAMLGMVWQGGGRSFKLMPAKSLPSTSAVKKYFEKITDVVADAFDDSKAGLTVALEEYMIDQGAFGTSGTGVFEGMESDLEFRAFGVHSAFIAESASGQINTIYCKFEWPLRKVLEKYGFHSLSPKLKESVGQGKLETKVKILHSIEPRMIIDVRRLNNLNMPYESHHMEIDSKHTLKESGFPEIPILFARFRKNFNETYGRGPGIDSLPDNLELQAVKEFRMLAQEKALDPPIGVFHDSILGGNKIDTSASAINVFKAVDQIGNKNPLFPLFEGQNIREADKQIEDLKQTITEHFNIDRLLDFNNKTQMTLGEAQLRSQLRGESLGSLFTRQFKEHKEPIVERGVNILFRKGRLGVFPDDPRIAALEAEMGDELIIIPNAVAELMGRGKDFYQIKHDTPAARLIDTEQAQGVMQTWQAAGEIAQLKPDVLNRLDADASIKVIARVAGAPAEILLDDETVKLIKEKQEAQIQQQQQLSVGAQGAALAKDATQAEKQGKEAEAL